MNIKKPNKRHRRNRNEKPASPGRQVFGPHPWRDRLHASREGGKR